MARPRGADATGLLLCELELRPPAEEWHRRNMFGGPWSDPEDMSLVDDNPKLFNSVDPLNVNSPGTYDVYNYSHVLWHRKRRMSERDAAFGLNASVGLGVYLGARGSQRDVTAVWKTGLEGVWYKDGKHCRALQLCSERIFVFARYTEFLVVKRLHIVDDAL